MRDRRRLRRNAAARGSATLESGEQRIGGVAGAGDVAAVEIEVVLGERVELGVQVDGGDAFDDRALRQVGRRRAPCGAMPKAVAAKPARPSETAAASVRG